MNRRSSLLATSAAVAATAAVGGAGTTVTSRWYRELDKPSWQPPGWAFGPAWTVLYALLAVAGGRALDRAGPAGSPARRRYAQAYAANLLLNAGWSWLFFRARRPDAAAVEALLLSASTVDLARRTWRLDPASGLTLVPYAAWTTFAAALTTSIARRNR